MRSRFSACLVVTGPWQKAHEPYRQRRPICRGRYIPYMTPRGAVDPCGCKESRIPRLLSSRACPLLIQERYESSSITVLAPPRLHRRRIRLLCTRQRILASRPSVAALVYLYLTAGTFSQDSQGRVRASLSLHWARAPTCSDHRTQAHRDQSTRLDC